MRTHIVLAVATTLAALLPVPAAHSAAPDEPIHEREVCANDWSAKATGNDSSKMKSRARACLVIRDDYIIRPKVQIECWFELLGYWEWPSSEEPHCYGDVNWELAFNGKQVAKKTDNGFAQNSNYGSVDVYGSSPIPVCQGSGTYTLSGTYDTEQDDATHQRSHYGGGDIGLLSTKIDCVKSDLTMSVDPALMDAKDGDKVTVKLTVNNTSQDTLKNVTVLWANFSIKEDSHSVTGGSAPCTEREEEKDTYKCPLADMPPGSTTTLTFTATTDCAYRELFGWGAAAGEDGKARGQAGQTPMEKCPGFPPT